MSWSSGWKMNSCNTWIDPCNTWVESMYYMGHPVTFTDDWSSTAPETVIIPAPLIPVVDRMLAAPDGLATEDLAAVSHCSQILFNLFQFCSKTSPVGHSAEHMDTDQDHHVMEIVPCLRALLMEMLTMCKMCFKSEHGQPQTQAWPRHQGLPPVSAFEDMVRTAAFYPGYPVFRTLPFWKHDYLNLMALHRRQANKNRELAEDMQELNELSKLRGVTCNKYKDHLSKRVTPGLFTAFCCGCSMCVGFELMDDVESPKTLFLVVLRETLCMLTLSSRPCHGPSTPVNQTCGHPALLSVYPMPCEHFPHCPTISYG